LDIKLKLVFDNFDGITIYIYDWDHNPPHFHARSAGEEVVIVISTLEVLRGGLHPAKLKKVLRWARGQKVALLEEFNRLNPQLRP
jgi:hypothetical protein